MLLFEEPCIPWLPAELLAFGAASAASPSLLVMLLDKNTWDRGAEALPVTKLDITCVQPKFQLSAGYPQSVIETPGYRICWNLELFQVQCALNILFFNLRSDDPRICTKYFS